MRIVGKHHRIVKHAGEPDLNAESAMIKVQQRQIVPTENISAMKRLLPFLAAAFFILPANAWAKAPEKNPAQIKREFTRSLDRVKKSLSKCWRPDESFKGSLSFRLILDKDGNVKNIMRFVGENTDTAIEKTAIAAIQSCQPYVVRTSHRHSIFMDVVLTRQIEIFSDPAPAEQQNIIPARLQKPTLTDQEIASLAKKVAACIKKSDFDSKSDTELELHLNRDGTVARGATKILSAATPEVGRITLEATFRCQPYLLPAEKYDAWKAMVLVFVAGGGPE